MNGDASERLGERVRIVERRVHRLRRVQVVRGPRVHAPLPHHPPTGEHLSHRTKVGLSHPGLARSQRGGTLSPHSGDCPPYRVRRDPKISLPRLGEVTLSGDLRTDDGSRSPQPDLGVGARRYLSELERGRLGWPSRKNLGNEVPLKVEIRYRHSHPGKHPYRRPGDGPRFALNDDSTPRNRPGSEAP